MNPIVKIQFWTGLLGKNRIFLSIFYHFVVIFVQKVNFGLSRGAIWSLFEASTLDSMTKYEA